MSNVILGMSKNTNIKYILRAIRDILRASDILQMHKSFNETRSTIKKKNNKNKADKKWAESAAADPLSRRNRRCEFKTIGASKTGPNL